MPSFLFANWSNKRGYWINEGYGVSQGALLKLALPFLVISLTGTNIVVYLTVPSFFYSLIGVRNKVNEDSVEIFQKLKMQPQMI